MKPTIFKYMDISTVHITKQDCDLLTEDATTRGRTLTVYEYPEGFFVHVADDLDEEKATHLETGYSQYLINILEIARKAECYFVRLDADGEVYDELPQHNWS